MVPGGCPGFWGASLLLLLLAAWTPPTNAGAPRPSPDLFALPEEAFAFSGSRAATLPNTISPTAYNIKLTPDYQSPLESTTDFSGTVEITFKVDTATKQIDLLANIDMDVEAVSIMRNTVNYAIDSQVRVEQTDVYRIITKDNLPRSTTLNGYTYKMVVNFKGKFQENNYGFYKSTYEKQNGEKGVLFTTQFQATHARKAFPCLDEPKFRATFQLSISVPDGYSALFNSPVDTDQGVNPSVISFKQTTTMSTYLVAFVVYETESFVSSHSVVSNDVPIRTWARKDAMEQGLLDYSQEITFKVLRELEDFTGIPYKNYMEKIDQVAVPDFAAGAMENWGLITYREGRFLYDESSDPEATRKSVAAIIGHELTHQWFGNLVTTSWWDTTWLNEGFARFFQYYILSRIHPNWRMMDQLLLDQQMTVFVRDAVNGALPLSYDVTSVQEISDIFSTITYSKGASIVRMIMHITEEDCFQKGLQVYLKRAGAVTPSNLFTDLNTCLNAARKPDITLENAMKTWTEQAGFPVVHIEREYYNETAYISQYRYFTDGTVEREPSTYYIPITWSSRDDSTERFFWFSESTSTLKDLPFIENWMLVHANGYYRVNYDTGNWITLSLTLAGDNQEQISPANRAKLVDDALALTHIGRLPYSTLSYLLRYLPHEKDVLPWAAADRGLRLLDIPLANNDPDGVFYGYLRYATEAAYKALSGFTHRGDAPEIILRNKLLYWACRTGNEQCLEEATRLLLLHVEDKTPLDPNLSDVILCYGTRGGDGKLWEKMWNLYVAAEDSTEQSSLLTALACTEDKTYLNTLFYRIAQGQNDADPAQTRSAFQKVITHPVGVDTALDFVVKTFSQMRQWLTDDVVFDIIRDITAQLSSEEQHKKISTLLERQLLDNLVEEEIVDEIVGKAKVNVEAAQVYAESALEAFSKASPEAVTVIPQTNAPTTDSGSHITSTPLLFLAMLFTLGKFIN